jgi:hypothetical protein
MSLEARPSALEPAVQEVRRELGIPVEVRLEEKLYFLPADSRGTLLEMTRGAELVPVLAAPRLSRVAGTAVTRAAILFARCFAGAKS